MALAKVHTAKGSANGTRRAPRAIVKQAAAKRRRAEGRKAARAEG